MRKSALEGMEVVVLRSSAEGREDVMLRSSAEGMAGLMLNSAGNLMCGKMDRRISSTSLLYSLYSKSADDISIVNAKSYM